MISMGVKEPWTAMYLRDSNSYIEWQITRVVFCKPGYRYTYLVKNKSTEIRGKELDWSHVEIRIPTHLPAYMI